MYVNGITYGISSKKVDELNKKTGEVAVSSAGVGGARTARLCFVESPQNVGARSVTDPKRT